MIRRQSSLALSPASTSDDEDYDLISNPESQSHSLTNSTSSLPSGSRTSTTNQSSAASQPDSISAASHARSFSSTTPAATQSAAEMAMYEPQPCPGASETFDIMGLTARNIQEYAARNVKARPVRNGAPASQLSSVAGKKSKSKVKDDEVEGEGTVRVYVDGVFNGMDVGQLHQLRQAKLSFPSVRLLVGVFSDSQCHTHLSHSNSLLAHSHRLELTRHIRWVDEVLPAVPWRITPSFLDMHGIDYVAVEEGASVDPRVDRERLRGWDEARAAGRVLPTRKVGVKGVVCGIRVEGEDRPAPLTSVSSRNANRLTSMEDEHGGVTPVSPPRSLPPTALSAHSKLEMGSEIDVLGIGISTSTLRNSSSPLPSSHSSSPAPPSQRERPTTSEATEPITHLSSPPIPLTETGFAPPLPAPRRYNSSSSRRSYREDEPSGAEHMDVFGIGI